MDRIDSRGVDITSQIIAQGAIEFEASSSCGADRVHTSRRDYSGIAQHALDTLMLYESMGVDQRRALGEHAVRVFNSATAFAGGRIHPLALSMSFHHDTIDRFLNIESSKCTEVTALAAKDVLKRFFDFGELSELEEAYSVGILGDMVYSETSSKHYRVEAARLADLGIENEEMIEMISEHYVGEIPAKAWRAVIPTLDLGGLASRLKDSNIESHYIKANELIDNFRKPSSERPSAHIQDVLEAESFYAVIMEALKFDGVAAVLRGEAQIIRLVKQGKIEAVGEGRRFVRRIEEIGIENIVRYIFGGRVGSVSPAVGIDASLGRAPVMIGDFDLSLPGGLEGHYRVKHEGAYAQKRLDSGRLMDGVAMTVVVEDTRELSQVFGQFVGQELSRFRPAPPPLKKEAVYVQGAVEFQEMIRSGLGRTRYVQFEVPDSPEAIARRGYKNLEVAKVTFYMKMGDMHIPIEIQFVTREERSRMRRGKVSHLIYKHLQQVARSMGVKRLPLELEKQVVNDAMIWLQPIEERSAKMDAGSLKLNPRSVDRAKELLFAIKD